MNLKSILFSLIFFAAFQCGISAQQVFKNNELTISKLEKNVWVIETSDMTTMYLIEGTKKAMLIDTGTQCEKLDSIIALITQKPLYVVITHAHGDHDGNIRFFKEIYLHPADTVLLGKGYMGKVNFVKDGDIFDLGGINLEVVHTPAHTPGSIVLIDRKAGTCYSGDAFGSGQVWLQLKPLSPMQTYVQTCRKMEKLMGEGITRIYCGHYPYVKKAYDRSYIEDMEKLAILIDQGKQPTPQPHPNRIPGMGAKNPMMSTLGQATIVYDPENLK